MTDFQQNLLVMTEDELAMSIARVMNDLSDIASATDKSFALVAHPDQPPVILVNGAVSNDFSFGGEI